MLNLTHWFKLAIVIASLVLMVGCGGNGTYSPTASTGGGGGTNPIVPIKLTLTGPTPPDTTPGGTLQFYAIVTGSTNTKVDWSVVSDGGGSITQTGLYTAPGSTGVYTIKAAADADPSVFQTMAVTVGSHGVITLTIIAPYPSDCPVGGTLQYKAVVTGTTNTSVTWSVVTDGGGTIDQTGLYHAPNTPGAYYILCTSNADPSVSAETIASVEPSTGSLSGTIQ